MLIESYAAGRRTEALAALEDWEARPLQLEVEALRDAGPDATAAFPLRAAVMLHTDAAARARGGVPLDESETRCRRGLHDELAAELVPLLTRTDLGRSFARRWFLAATLDAHGRFCFTEARSRAQAGLRLFPDDAELLLASGTIDEVEGSLPGWAQAQPEASQRSRQLRDALAVQSERLAYLQRARGPLQRAAGAGLDEARLRLGRVEWALGHEEAARAALEETLRRGPDPSVLYLAHLFLGRVHEQAERLEDAEREYRAALAAFPSSQAAAVALSWVLQLAGDAAAAPEVLEAAVAAAARRHAPDPWWDYLLGRSSSAETVRDGLRDEASR